MHDTLMYFSLQGHGIAAHPLLMAFFVAITVPVTSEPLHVGHAEPGIALQSPSKHS